MNDELFIEYMLMKNKLKKAKTNCILSSISVFFSVITILFLDGHYSDNMSYIIIFLCMLSIWISCLSDYKKEKKQYENFINNELQ